MSFQVIRVVGVIAIVVMFFAWIVGMIGVILMIAGVYIPVNVTSTQSQVDVYNEHMLIDCLEQLQERK